VSTSPTFPKRRTTTAATLAFRLALLVYPLAFRARFGDDMARAFREGLATAHGGALRYFLSSIGDAVAGGLNERRLARRASRASHPSKEPVMTRLVHSIHLDVRYALRIFTRQPLFAITAVLTLAIGIGANATIFSVLKAVLLDPLPYADSSRLVIVGELERDGTASNVGYATFEDWRDRSRDFEEMAVIRSWTPTLTVHGQPERMAALRVSWNFFRMLGVAPALGRDFHRDEDTPAGWHVVVLSDGLWRRSFGADPSVLGRVITMNDVPFTVVGVLPASYEPLISEEYYRRADMWAPVGYDRTLPYACRSCEHLRAIGRLRAGASIEAARDDLTAVQTGLRKAFPSEYARSAMTLIPLQDELTGRVRPALTVLMGAVGFLLLIACANVANLLLARVTRRERELALRAALGAGRARVVRQLMVESALLAGAAGALGIAIAAVAVPLVVQLTPAAIARLGDAHLDRLVLTFSIGLTAGTAILFGLMPAIRASRVDLQSSLHGDGRRTSDAPTSIARRLLVAADVAMAVVLLVGAGLMIRSVDRLLGVDPGFDPDHVLSMQVSMVGDAYRKDEAVVATTDRVLARLRALPGVEAVAAAGQIPLGGNGDRWGFHVEGREWGPTDPSVERYSVTPDYFRVMHIPLRRGRLFTDADRAGSENVMIVAEETARTLWPESDPIGQRVRIGGTDGPWRTIVGIVGNVRHRELALPPTMQMYLPQAQLTDSFLAIVMRAAGDPAILTSEARTAIWSVASDVPVYGVAPLDQLVARSVGPRRFVMALLGLFGAVALLLTALGVYGVIAQSVVERTREIGIRSALGASAGDIGRLIAGTGLLIVCAGLVTGFAVALVTTRYLEASLYEVSALDPATFAGVAVVLLGVAVVAQGLPVVRATRVDPSVALRQE
jgi:putative ABC transport system permease protein